MPNLNLLTLLSRSRATSLTSNLPSSAAAAEDSNTRQEQKPRASQSDNTLPRSSLSISSPSPSPSPLERRIHPNLNALAAELSNSPSHSRQTDTQSHELSESTTSRAPSSDDTIPFVSLTPWLRSRRHSTGGAANLTAPSSSSPITNPATLTTTNTNTNTNAETKTNNTSSSSDNVQSENPLPKSRSSTASASDPAQDSSPEHDIQDNSYSSSASPAPSSNHRPESSRANRLLTRLTNIGLRSSPTPQSQPPSAWNTFGRRKTRQVNSIPHMSDFGASAASSEHSRESSHNTNPLHRHEGDLSGYTTHSASFSDSNSYSNSQSHMHSIQDSYSAPYSVPQSPQSPQSQQSSQAPSHSQSNSQSRSPSYGAMTPPTLHRQQQFPSSSGFTFGSMGSGPQSRDPASPTTPPLTSVLRLSLFGGGRRQASASTGAEDRERENEKSRSVSEQSVGAGAGAEAQARSFQFNIDSIVLPQPRTSTSMPSMSEHRTLDFICDDDNQNQDGMITSGTGSSSSRPRAQDIFNTLSTSSSQHHYTGSRRTRRDTSRSSGGSSTKRRTRRGSRAVPARPALAGAFEIGAGGIGSDGNLTRADNVQVSASVNLSEQGPSLESGSIDIQTSRNLSAAGDTLGTTSASTKNNTNIIPPTPSSTQDRDTNIDLDQQPTYSPDQDDMVTETTSIDAKAKGKGRARALETPSPSSRKSSVRSTPSVSSPLAGSSRIPLPSVSPPSTPIRSAMASRSVANSPPSPSPVARGMSKGKRKADEAEVDSVTTGIGVGAGGGGNTLEVKKQHRATFAADPRPYRSSNASQNSYRPPQHYRKRPRISSAGSSAPSSGGSETRPPSRGTGQPHQPHSPSRSLHRIPSGRRSSRTPSTSSRHHYTQPHRQGSISHPANSQSHYQPASRSRERVESTSHQSQVSIPISAILTPHAPSISISQHPSTMTGRGPGYHMRDPRKPPRVQDTPWSLTLPERGFFAEKYGDCFTLPGVFERLSSMIKKARGGEGGGNDEEKHDSERVEGDRRDIEDEQERAARRASLRWTESGGSPLHAWLFFLGFILFPVWWVAGFLVAVPRTRRLGGGGGGDGEKGVLLDDPQLEHDAKSWRTRCRVMAAVSLITYVPFIVLIAVFVPRMT